MTVGWRLRVAAIGVFLTACDVEKKQREDNLAQWKAAWEAACQDETVLLATTAGSPNGFKCPNKMHRMKVQVATAPSNEEAAAVVFCECLREPQEKAP